MRHWLWKEMCMFGEKNCRVTIIKKIDMQVEICMLDCLRNNDIYYCGLRLKVNVGSVLESELGQKC